MLFFTILKVAFKSLAASKLRTFLAMLGIIIGVGAVIAMLAYGEGNKKLTLDRYTAMGTNLLVVRPGNRGTGGVISGTSQNLTLDDAQALVTEAADVKEVAPVVGGNVQVKYSNKNSRTSLTGTSPSYFTARNFEVETGRGFTDAEAEQVARVAVIGPVTAENLFGNSKTVDETIKLNGVNFKVIGIFKSKGDQGYFNPDDQVVIPYSTAMKQVLGVQYVREIDIVALDGADLTKMQESVTAVLHKRHRIRAGAADDFNIRNQAELIETREKESASQQLFLGVIAGISLLVGGIGIMNIMLVTVTERTREIGVRKAIGAKERDILAQFLIEAILLSGLGGVLGVCSGYGAAKALESWTLVPSIVTDFSVILSLLFSVGVGVFFGFYPAVRASRMNPIEALRYE